MADSKKAYETVIVSFDAMNWHYNRDDKEQTITCKVKGDDLTMNILYKVIPDREIMYVKSAMPFTVAQDKLMPMCVAATIANYTMLNGSFELDISDGYLGFKIVTPFYGSEVTQELCTYMINLTCRMVDIYNDKFLAVAEGRMSLNEFREFAEHALD